MTGMKEGAGEDPFADDGDAEASAERSDPETTRMSSEPSGDSSDRGSDRRSPRQRQMQIPYKFRRDGVQDGRDRVPLFLHPDTKSDERDALRELEERFDDDVSLTDLREALVMVGLDHLDEVEINLEEWGYGMTFGD